MNRREFIKSTAVGIGLLSVGGFSLKAKKSSVISAKENIKSSMIPEFGPSPDDSGFSYSPITAWELTLNQKLECGDIFYFSDTPFYPNEFRVLSVKRNGKYFDIVVAEIEHRPILEKRV